MFVALCQGITDHHMKSFHAARIECLSSKERDTKNFKKMLKFVYSGPYCMYMERVQPHQIIPCSLTNQHMCHHFLV